MGGEVVRNAEQLTAAQKSEILEIAKSLGIHPDDVIFYRGPTVYSDMLDKILVGPNVLPKAGAEGANSVLARLGPREALAHENGHLLTTRAGNAFTAGSALDEFQASIVAARQTPGLTQVERWRLLRDAYERAVRFGGDPKELRKILGY